jgi:putative colanic acid biosynthesis acetyltransferase WcaF
MTGPADQFRARPYPNPLGTQLERIAFRAVWLALARFTPPQLHAWRCALLRLFGAKVGKRVRVYGSAHIWLPRNLALGDGAWLGPGAVIYNQGAISIGPETTVSQRAFLCASTHSVSDPGFALVLRPIALGRGCWVAAEAFVGPGVTMGDGAVLAARGALFEDAEAMGIYRGNPAMQIGQRRFEERGR